MMIFSKRAALLFLATMPMHAVMANQFSVELRANIPEVCHVEPGRASVLADTTILSVVAACNTPRYLLQLNGVDDIQILSASSVALGKDISVQGDAVLVRQTRPGTQELQIELSNSIAELAGIGISIETIK